MSKFSKQNFKIKLEHHLDFKKAWVALLKLGYQCHINTVPYNANYLYVNQDGSINTYYFDLKESDLENPKSTLDYFKRHPHTEISLQELLALVKKHRNSQMSSKPALIKKERPLFEKAYAENMGDLSLLTWEECENGIGDYQPNFKAIAAIQYDSHFDEYQQYEKMIQHAENVNNCFMAWVLCANNKAIPSEHYVMPMQPSLAMLNVAKVEFEDLEISDLYDRITFAHQGMIQVFLKSQKQTG